MLQDNFEPKEVTLEQHPLNITMVRIHGNLRVREASTEAVAETNEIARNLRGQERLLSVSLYCGTAPSLKTGIKKIPSATSQAGAHLVHGGHDLVGCDVTRDADCRQSFTGQACGRECG